MINSTKMTTECLIQNKHPSCWVLRNDISGKVSFLIREKRETFEREGDSR